MTAPFQSLQQNEGFRGKQTKLREQPTPPPPLSSPLPPSEKVLKSTRGGRKKRKGGWREFWLEPMERDHNSDCSPSQNKPIAATVSGFEPRADHYTTTSSWWFKNSNLQIHRARPAPSLPLLRQDASTLPYSCVQNKFLKLYLIPFLIQFSCPQMWPAFFNVPHSPRVRYFTQNSQLLR